MKSEEGDIGWDFPYQQPACSLKPAWRAPEGGWPAPQLQLFSAPYPGAQAEVNADQVATVMWDYFTQLSNNAKEAVEQLQKSELTQQLK